MEKLCKFKEVHSEVEIDFERKEKDIRQSVWLIDVGILYMSAHLEGADQEDQEANEQPLWKPIGYEAFKNLDATYTTLNLG